MKLILDLLIYFSIGFAGLRLLISFYNLLSKPVLDKHVLNNSSLITHNSLLLSILIPARNEEHNLPKIISSLLEQPFKNFELIILDDNSSDRTSEIVNEYSKENEKIKLIEGKELPDGWLGKNWACHQLSQVAAGQYLLFLDADVIVKGDSILKAISVMQKDQLSLLSIFPEQQIYTFGEKLTVPIMHYLLLSLLPLDFIFLFKESSLAAANGQFMLFNSNDYQKHNFHQLCKSEVVEDIKIMQSVKEKGLKGKTLLGTNLIFCRMYYSFKEGFDGFSKNLLSGFGGSKIGLISFLVLIIFIPIYMVFERPILALIYLVLSLTIRLLVSLSAKQSILENLCLHPGQMFSLLLISFKSITNTYNKTLEWKGRKIG